jgi:diguanylate cyclase
VRLAIDDFGTGYSSLNYLRRLPVDVVKIDRSFVAELGWGGAEDTIIAGIIGLTLGLGLDVVAEGIELPEQAESLLELGCTRGQGFLYSRARHLDDVIAAALAPDPDVVAAPHSLP